MKSRNYIIILLITILGGIVHGTEESLQFGSFGMVNLYYQSPQPTNVVLFVSGDGGWNLGVVEMARSLSSLNTLVIGIDIVHYLGVIQKSTESCLYPAGDFEMLSQYIQKKMNYAGYDTPILIGYSSGATLVYASMVQAPATTFKGAISIGFCPDLQLSKPLCHGSGLEWTVDEKKGYLFQPAVNLEVPWIVLQGEVDQVCLPSGTEKYVQKVKGAKIISLPKVGHGFSVQKNWLPQFKQAFIQLASEKQEAPPPAISELQDLPLIEIPAVGNSTNLMAVLISGDGGWAYLDKCIARLLSENGVDVIGLNSLKYFWKARSPAETSSDMERILHYYLPVLKKEKVILIGYSMGADVLPFVINRLSPALCQQVCLAVFLGLSHTADFEFHFSNWLSTAANKNSLAVKPEFLKLRGIKKLCCYGEEDQETLCRDFNPAETKIIVIKGGHRLGGNYQAVVQAILQEIK